MQPEGRTPESRRHLGVGDIETQVLKLDHAREYGIEGDNHPVAAASTSVFISRIRNLPVLDDAGDQVGKMRDVVLQRRADGRAPRIKGLVVELFARHRIFIPMARVRTIDALQVVISGVVNTWRFERRESEMLVVDDLFDRTVQRLDHRPPR